MSIQNNQKNIKTKLLRKKGKENIRENILKLLDSAKFGLNYSQIAEQLDLSRNTVKKYVETLKEEDKVLIMEIGRSNICLIKRDMIDSPRDVLDRVGFLANDFMISFFRAFEKIFSPLHTNLKELIKEIGREMSKTMVWPTVEISDSIDPTKDKRVYLIQIGNVCIQHFEVFNQFGKVIEAEIIPPPSNATSSLVLRVKYTLDFEDTEFFYHMISGFYEQKLHENFGKNLFTRVLEIQKENSICYFESGFNEEEI